MIDILTWFFDQEDSWPWVLRYEEYGIVAVEIRSKSDRIKQIHITLLSGRLIGIAVAENRYSMLYRPYLVTELFSPSIKPGFHRKPLGYSEYLDISELFDSLDV